MYVSLTAKCGSLLLLTMYKAILLVVSLLDKEIRSVIEYRTFVCFANFLVIFKDS